MILTDATEAAAHEHRWVSRPVTTPTFDWKCEDAACGETVSLEWRPEFAGLGFGDLGRIMEAEHGGTVIPLESGTVAVTPEEALTAVSRILDLMIGHPLTGPRFSAEFDVIREGMKADGLYREAGNVVG